MQLKFLSLSFLVVVVASVTASHVAIRSTDIKSSNAASNIPDATKNIVFNNDHTPHSLFKRSLASRKKVADAILRRAPARHSENEADESEPDENEADEKEADENEADEKEADENEADEKEADENENEPDEKEADESEVNKKSSSKAVRR
jgi:cobalamin biosynthesis protein CobT